MISSLRTLLAGIVDYAGLFPPAQLPLEQAVVNYARYRQGPDAWMLGRFVCPAAKLKLLSAFHDDLFAGGPPVAVAVLGPADSGWAECRAHLDEALRCLTDFRNRHGDRVTADVLEMKVPLDLVVASDPKLTADGLNEIRAVVETAGCGDLTVFFECGFEAGEQTVATVLEAISMCNRDASVRAGYKLRCGGPVAQSIPTAEQIAFVIRNAVINDVPLKATAGLHHPFPRFDATVQAKTHGFVNVFAAGVLGFARHLEPSLLADVLRDEDPAHFVFGEAEFRHGLMHAKTAEIAAARREGIIAFGSCSFDEPRDDLRALGWL